MTQTAIPRAEDRLTKKTSISSPLHFQIWNAAIYQIYTIWLFTFSDIKTIIIPTSVFGLIGAFSGMPLLSGSLSRSIIGSRAPHVLFWIWSTLLPFAINNQSSKSAILEDSLNKPWRPMPSGRISVTVANTFMLVMYGLNMLVSFDMGAHRQALSMLLLGIWYNRLGGADRSCVEKNFINAAGYISFTTGALSVACNTKVTGVSFGPIAVPWFIFIGFVILTTVHAQDFEDMDGDAARQRWTVPLVIGENAARWLVSLAMPFWSILIPWYFGTHPVGYIGPTLLAAVLAYRFLVKREREDDKKSFRIWNLWMISLYTVPFYVSR